jgi:hypothetical protein
VTTMENSRSTEGLLKPWTNQSAETNDPALTCDRGQQLEVHVLYTTHKGTLAALKTASQLAANLSTCPRVLRLYSVPYTLPLERPAVSTDFLEEQIRALACESPMEFSARIYLCREPRWSLRQLFPPHSVIVIAGKKRWWPTKEQSWAKWLRKDGHEVIFLDAK